MSRHSFSAGYSGEGIDVVMGWDPHLQGYFMYVERHDGPGDDSEESFIFSNLHHAKDSHPKTLDPFLAVLSRLEIDVPTDIISDVQNDAQFNR